MDETFYNTLGVDSGAGEAAIKDAYRKLVKETHPDVSDDPDAAERFTRLTTARDVLVDGEERRRYDRLGHNEYVRTHVDSPVWAPSVATEVVSESENGRGRSSRGRSRGTSCASDRMRSANDRHAGTNRDTSGGVGADFYTTRRPGAYIEKERTLQRFLDVVRAAGPWLFVHLVLFVSAVATFWFTYAATSAHVESIPIVLGGVALLAVVTFVSVIHTVTQVYT